MLIIPCLVAWSLSRHHHLRPCWCCSRRPHAHRLSKISQLRKGEKTSLVLFESLNWNVYYRLYRHLFKAFPFPGTVVLSPDLMLSMLELWKKLAMKFPEQAYSCRAIAR